MKFSWRCPYCNHNAIIDSNNISTQDLKFDMNNKDGHIGLRTSVIVCPNPDCKEYEIEVFLAEVTKKPGYVPHINANQKIESWKLKPNSMAKLFPTYIPEVLRKDYEEACLIRDLSPKASATLSRRCLQGIIRDFWGIKIDKPTLFKEINAIEDKVDPLLWEALHDIRSIGNIGAHMEQDINKIIDVEPEEAQLLIELIELLFEECYVTRHQRQKKLEAIKAVKAEKEASKKA